MKKILVINGPNLNMLGTRETNIYGNLTLEELEKRTKDKLAITQPGLETTWWQSNSESEIIERIHQLTNENYDALIINPAAFSHTSIAILDALKILQKPIAEVHLSNVYARESYRHSLLTAQAASIIMGGLGLEAYYFAALALVEINKG